MLEDNNIICNYQAAPDEEGFTAAGALRLGVAEMTRFGMGPDGLRRGGRRSWRQPSAATTMSPPTWPALRSRFTELGYCFAGPEFDPLVQRLHELI